MSKFKSKLKTFGREAWEWTQIVGIILGLVAALLVAIAVIICAAFAPIIVHSALLWVCWTPLGLGDLFTSLPEQVRNLSYVYFFAGMLAWRIVMGSTARSLGLHRKAPANPGIELLKKTNRKLKAKTAELEALKMARACSAAE